MNVMTEWLERWFDEVEPREFYRGIFPSGSFQRRGEYRGPGTDAWGYNGILVSVTNRKKADGSPFIKRYTVTDDLEVIDQDGRFLPDEPYQLCGAGTNGSKCQILLCLRG